MFGRTNRKEKSTYRPMTQQVASWSISLEHVLDDPDGLKTFTEFLKREYSTENITFWVKCRDFSEITKASERRKVAKEMFELYLHPKANEAVNINNQTRQIIISLMEESPPSLFSEAQREVFIMMKFDSYQRFLKSNIYIESINAEKQGRPLPCNFLPVSPSPTGARFRSKSREKSRNVNSASFAMNNGKAMNDDASVPPGRRSFLTYKKDMDIVWNRLQSRMDDQRGMELKCDMPDFLLQ